MNRQNIASNLSTAVCVLVAITVIGATPVIADERPATDGGATASVCDQRFADAYAEIDALETDFADSGLSENERLQPIQAILTQANYEVSLMDCSTAVAREDE